MTVGCVGLAMDRRNFLTAFIGAPAVAALLAACGDNSSGSADTAPTDTGSTPTTPLGIPHPTGANEMVIRIGYEGGFVMPSYLFQRVPNLLVSGDGRAFVPGAQAAIYPGPLLPAFTVRTIDEAGVQAVLAAAQAAGLLAAAPDYSIPADAPQVADAPNTVVAINANGTTYVHSAYALGIGGETTESTPARTALLTFVNAMSDLAGVAGAEHVGTEELWNAPTFRLRATPNDPSGITDPAPTVLPWPADTGVTLAAASNCVQADAAKVGEVLGSANQLTFFTEADSSGATVTYEVVAVQLLPGDEPC